MKKDAPEKNSGDRVIEALAAHLRGRAGSYEIFFSSDAGLGVEAKDGCVDALKVRSGRGVGLRTITGNRLGFGFSSVLTGPALRELADKTVAGSIEASEDGFLAFPAPGAVPAPIEGLLDDKATGVSEEDKIASALAIEAAAMAYDPRIKRVRKASYGETLSSRRVVNSNGVDSRHSATYFSGSVTAVAEDGESQMGWEMAASHLRSGMDFAAIGAGAAKNAVRMLGARKPASMKCPAIIENVVVTELLETLAGSFLADNVSKGKSMLAGKLGVKVASGAVSIVDNGVMPGGWASSACDGEGVPKGVNVLLDKGVCAGYLYDTYWAARAGTASTGSSVRSSFKGMAALGFSNLFMKAGEKDLSALLQEMGTGLYITELLGAHTMNPVNGDFSVGAAGIRVEGGAFAYPVRGMAVSGNLLELFSKVAACASDLRFLGSVGAPSILIEEMEASGS
ncbi:MAG: TldD/PmbA family protein [Deltaproteobacteria bacterium]|nr:TldD/PmbA family protein [Deltaproteobacteria bacterium]